ncbi:NADPH-dependent FMN reductase [uncultured Paraglaciecola sp.]|uniref:NADPH-dependent FMN reductase n=1 Tax=uncultured Paraglaciecola sp. TaxID=1765024 RepID=UPI0030D71A1B|tara:strand:+ start:32962 stop:33528 length:567 start_codon:yes stop_codon:yes gene_type:complete
MDKLKLVALSGSLRNLSYNHAALQALKNLSVKVADIDILTLGNVPIFNPDREQDAIPAVKSLKSHLNAANGLIISSPEYAHEISGVMKNTLDWLVSGEEFVNMPIMLINTSPRATHAQQMLREVIVTMSGNIIEKSYVAIPLLGTSLDVQGIMTDSQLSGLLKTGLDEFCIAINDLLRCDSPQPLISN